MKNEVINKTVRRQVTNLVNASRCISDWLAWNGIPINDWSTDSCPCCGDIVLSFYIENKRLSRFELVERRFWAYVRKLFPLHEYQAKKVDRLPFEPLVSARLDDRRKGEWALVVQPCDSTYGQQFPDRDFWQEKISAGEKQLAS